MYRPCQSNRPTTVYQQQVHKLVSINHFECPCEAILVDMAKEVNAWQEEGNHVILLMDFNDDVMDMAVRQWAASLSLVEAITWLHQESLPPTYQRGQ